MADPENRHRPDKSRQGGQILNQSDLQSPAHVQAEIKIGLPPDDARPSKKRCQGRIYRPRSGASKSRLRWLRARDLVLRNMSDPPEICSV